MKKFIKKYAENKKTFLFLVGPKNPAADPKDLFSDTYIYLAKAMIKNGFIDEAIFLYNQHPLYLKNYYKVTDKITAYFLGSNIDPEASGLMQQNFFGVFTRGNWQEHKEIFKKLKYNHSFFYAADKKFLPKSVSASKFDVIFIDEKYQIKDVKNKVPKAKAIIFDKPVNTDIFFSKKTKKIYDLCYIANYRQWKNHNMLFSAIKKFQDKNKKVLKVALAGIFEPSRRELELMLKKYDINADLYERVLQIQVANIFRQSKFSVQLAEFDANPRALTESLACNTPVLVNKELSGGLHLINNKTGKKTSLFDLDKNISYMLNNYQKYQPYEYWKNNLTAEQIIKRCFS